MADEININPEASRQTAENMKTAAEQVKEFSKEAEESSQALGSMARHMANIAKGSIEFNSEIKGAESLVKNVSKQAADIAKFTAEDLADKKKTEKLLQKQLLIKGNIQAIESKIAILLEKAANATEEEQKQLNKTLETLSSSVVQSKGLLKTFDQIEETNQKLNKSTSFFDGMSDLVQDVPVLNKLFGEFGKAAKAAREAKVEGKSSFIAGFKELAGAGSKIGLGFLVKGLGIGQTRITEFSRQLNVSREQAADLNKELVKSSASTQFLNQEMMQFQMSTAQALGVSTNFNESNARQTALLTSRLGLSVEQSQKLFELSAGTGQNFENSNNSITGQVLALNDANGTAIRYQTVMADIAEASTATALTTSKFPGGVAKAAFEARKFGLSLRQLESSSSALLDFQSSIEAELEAELLTGRALNLERARAAALTGDQATLAAELANNFGTAEEFLDQNVLAQKAQAEALGMTRDELASTLSRQEALNQLAKDFPKIKFDGLTLEQKIAKLQEQGLTKEQALEKLGEKELARQEKNQSVQEKLANAVDKLANAMSVFAKILDPIGAIFDGISKNATLTVTALTALSALRFGNIGRLFGKFKEAGKIFGKGGKTGSQSIGGMFSAGKKMLTKKVAGKGITKGLGKTLLKKIPGVGLLAGIGFGLQRALSGDLAGGGLELASGIASLFPGIGTAASVGIDAALVARDLKRQNTLAQSSQDIPLATGGIVTKPTRALVGEAGAEAVIPLREFYAKMDELISVVKQGGDVFMDGAKVGRATVLAGTNLS